MLGKNQPSPYSLATRAAAIGSLHASKITVVFEAPSPNALPTAPVVTNLHPHSTPLPMDDGEAKSAHCSSSSTWNTMPSSVTWPTSGATPTDPVSTYSWNGAIARLAATEPSFHSQASRPPGTFTVKRPSGDTPTLEANEASGK